jgi:hypothetical protein
VAREWVSGDRLVEAARLIVPEFVIEEVLPEMEHALQLTHSQGCSLVGRMQDPSPVSIFGSQQTGSAGLPLCLVCGAYYTQIMPTSLATQFATRHVEKEHADIYFLWANDFPWAPGDPRLN